MSTTTARPRQTTMAGWMVMLGSVFVVLSVWDAVSRLRSIESRESIARVLADLPGGAGGLSVEDGIQAAHTLAMVTALCAVAAVALGWEVLQRNRGARVALSVIAVPLFLTGMVTGGFAAALVAASTAFLWLSPSREWFAGQPIPEQGTRPPARPQVWEQTGNRTGGPGTGAWPDATSSEPAGHRALGPAATDTEERGAHPAAATGWSVSTGAGEQRPGAVTAALVLTVVVASVVFLITLASVVLLAAQPDTVLDEMRRQYPDVMDGSVPDSQLVLASYVSNAVILLWSAGAIALAILMATRRAWAARALMVCAAVCAVLCLVATLATPIAVVPAVAAVATVSCLRRPDVRAWFAKR